VFVRVYATVDRRADNSRADKTMAFVVPIPISELGKDWCSGRDSNPGLRLSSVDERRKAEILGPCVFNLAILGRRS
jgi:hypothetical protein